MSETETRTETAGGGYVLVRSTETRRGDFLRIDETREERLPSGRMLRSSSHHMRRMTDTPEASPDATPNA